MITALMICMVVRAANVVTIEYKGATATVTIPDELAAYVTCSTGTSSHVKLVQSDDVADGAPGEITYQLSGSSDDGGFEMSGNYKCTVKLAGLTLTNPKGAAINIDDGKRIELNANKETTNTLADGADGNWKACIYAKGHFELKGKGTINVVGNTAHAISCKEYMQVKNLTLNVTAAAKDGLHCQQYFWMQSGTVNISGAKANGIKVELDGKTPTDIYPEHENGDDDEDTGNCYLDDGKLTISDCGGAPIKVDGKAVYNGGTQNFDKTAVSEDNFTSTGIITLRNDVTSGEAVIYDLNGRRIDMLDGRKGVFIIRKGNEIRKAIIK